MSFRLSNETDRSWKELPKNLWQNDKYFFKCFALRIIGRILPLNFKSSQNLRTVLKTSSSHLSGNSPSQFILSSSNLKWSWSTLWFWWCFSWRTWRLSFFHPHWRTFNWEYWHNWAWSTCHKECRRWFCWKWSFYPGPGCACCRSWFWMNFWRGSFSATFWAIGNTWQEGWSCRYLWIYSQEARGAWQVDLFSIYLFPY